MIGRGVLNDFCSLCHRQDAIPSLFVITHFVVAAAFLYVYLFATVVGCCCFTFFLSSAENIFSFQSFCCCAHTKCSLRKIPLAICMYLFPSFLHLILIVVVAIGNLESFFHFCYGHWQNKKM